MKTMNSEQDQFGVRVKEALENEAGQLTLASGIRREVVAATERKGSAGGWSRLHNRGLVLAGAAGALIALGAILHVVRDGHSHHPEPYMQIRSEVRGGRSDAYWMEKRVEVRTRNGQEGYIKVEARWPRRTSVIALNMRRER